MHVIHNVAPEKQKFCAMGSIERMNFESGFCNPESGILEQQISQAVPGRRKAQEKWIFFFFFLINAINIYFSKHNFDIEFDSMMSSLYVNFTEYAVSAEWGPRGSFACLTFDSKLLCFGGQADIYYDDVWSSVNGASWSLLTDSPGWIRSGFSSEVLNNKVFLMGGTSGSSVYRNDVWSTVDGVIWNEVTSGASWSARSAFGSCMLNNKLFVMGGYGGGDRLNDVWSSIDGATWTLVTATAEWGKRNDFECIVLDNKMIVLGGHYNGKYNDVWSSTDGAVWTEITSAAAWGGRSGFSSAVYDNKLFVLGGHDGTNNLNDVWSSSDGGANWDLVTGSAGWSARNSLQSAVYDGKLFIMGGQNNVEKFNDVWGMELFIQPANEKQRTQLGNTVAGMWVAGSLAFVISCGLNYMR